MASKTLSAADFETPIESRFFEDYLPGAVYEYGSYEVTEAEVLEFASRFDPQRMHTDKLYAQVGPFNGLIASGWHTTAIFMRLFADHFLSKVATLPSPGIDEIRWLLPVRPGDSLKLRTTVVKARVSNSKPDRGLVTTKAELFNQDGQAVMSLLAVNLLFTRPPL
jgi:acyl dehydratase